MANHCTQYLILFLTLVTILLPLSSPFKTYTTLNQGSSLSSPADVLVSSPTGIFTAGFHAVGENAFCFAIWFTHAPADDGSPTVVWMANRDRPVNGRNSKLSLSHSGNLVLEDAGLIPVWSSNTLAESSSAVSLQLHDNGDLVLRRDATVMWRSFDSPTDTLLPQQPLAMQARLTSSRSLTNHSSGFYEFYFDNDNVLRLLYAGVELTSVFWPPAWMTSWAAGRSTYNTSKTAMLDSHGRFSSSDNFHFETSDVGTRRHRRMTLDPDGLARVYSFSKSKDKARWEVSWQLQKSPCSIHGICGGNSLCSYSHDVGRRCSCLPGYKIKNDSDWSEGCVPDFDRVPCKNNNSDKNTERFYRINHAEFYGYDIGYFQNRTLEECERLCLSYCDCRGFQFKFEWDTGVHSCYPKTLLFNGYQSSEFEYWIYLRLPNHMLSRSNKIEPRQSNDLHCTNIPVVDIERAYTKPNRYAWLRSLIWCVGVLGVVEVVCVLLFLYETRKSSNKLREQGFLEVTTGFRRFEYAEMKKATRNFSEEIGRGGSGVVYKGVLPDNRVAAIKCLSEASSSQGEAEFLAEISLIGRLNHANLVKTWGYCAEATHRMLVYEYMENGSLAENLESDKLDRRKRYEIAVGTAKGLAYLHEECLEWVLHCDVKPQNILLDGNYEAKVADFGLSKQGKRSGAERLNDVSGIRGTRGYMAPEWVFNLPITAKVDVYSYGIVVLEMVKEMNVDEEIEECDKDVENLERVGMLCAQENRDARPTMKEVVDMLLGY